MMRFNSVAFNVFAFYVLISTAAQAAEWKLEPSASIRGQYNDNVGMRNENNNPVSSTGYTLIPKIKFSIEEQNLWDVSLNTRGKFTRYQNLDDADSNNVFAKFDSGRKTERAAYRLNASYTRNTNFDDDFDTQSPIAGLVDNKTERKTVTFSPSIRWNSSQTSVAILSVNITDISYEEVTSLNLRGYTNDNISFRAYRQLLEKHSLGFTASYTEQDTPSIEFTANTAALNLDYTYKVNQRSSLELSLGARRVKSFTPDEPACDIQGGSIVPLDGADECPNFPPLIISVPTVIEGLDSVNDGTVINLSYSIQDENNSHNFNIARNVVPSSTGSVQEQRAANYRFGIKSTEKISSDILFDGSETTVIGGGDSSNDRTRYRVDSTVRYKLTRDWSLNFKYSYIYQNITNTDEDSRSNAIYINLSLNWPKLATTY